MGSLADKKPEQGQRISGILVKRNFNYHILSPCDLSSKYRQLCDQWVIETYCVIKTLKILVFFPAVLCFISK